MKKTTNNGGVMKKIILAALAACAIGGVIHAEPAPGQADPANYRIYKASDVVAGAAKIANSSFIHKVVISSPSNVDASTNSVLNIFNATDNTTNINPRFRVQLSSNEVTGATEWTFDIHNSSGLRVDHSTGDVNAGDVAGKVTVIYANPSPGYQVWSSSFMTVDTSTHAIARGPVLLHKVSVLKKSGGGSGLRIYDQYSSSTDTNRTIADIDITDTAREYVFNTILSSGITLYNTDDNTVDGDIMVFYRERPSRDFEMWESTRVTGTVSEKALFVGNGVFGGVLVTSATATSHLKVYGSNGTTSFQITEIDGMTTKPAQMFDVEVSSGLTVTSVGNAKYTVLYRRRR